MPPDIRTAIRAAAQRTGTDPDVSALKQALVLLYLFPRPESARRALRKMRATRAA